jgi:hypothetical protein
MVLIKLELPKRDATVQAVKRRYKLSNEELDEAFGVQLVDTKRGLYAVRLSPSGAQKVTGKPGAVQQSDLAIRAF